ncbi:MAG: hypothetical protein HYZ79_02345 [Candidatus Melainabacteria bacterium]|nr:hypothetical protein [Candidatus Melainabacteria bacterium]
MKKIIILIIALSVGFLNLVCAEEESVKVSKSETSKYSIEVAVTGIPANQQTLYIPIELDSMVVDLDKVALDDIAAQNILPVAASSKDKVGPGIGLLKLDDKGLPNSLKLKVFLKPVEGGKTDVHVGKVANEPALPVKGAMIRNDVTVVIESGHELNVKEVENEGKKRLELNEKQLTLNIQREEQKAETIFIPLLFDNKVMDIDESFGHAIIAPGVSMKTFSAGSLHGGGAGVEVVLSDVAEKDLSVNVDLIPKGTGSANIIAAYPQDGHTKLITGPVVQITPQTLDVALSDVVDVEKN